MSNSKSPVVGPVVPNAKLIAAIVFIGGAVGMMLELAGARLLAPYFGNSLFVWTSLIGVMLGFMSLGYFLGGRLADAKLDPANIFWILLGSSASIALVTFSEGILLPQLAKGGSLRLFAVIAATILFAVPSTLLGMVSPYCIRLRMHALEDSGATVGSLYAISTLGSIVGTFAAGFWLISLLGTRDLIMSLSLGLALTALLLVRRPFDARRLVGLGSVAALLALSFLGVARGADSIDTQYDRYYLRSAVDPASGQPLITLSRTENGAESVSYADTLEPYRFEYYNYYDLAAGLAGGARSTLLVGGGTLSYPRLYLEQNPDARMDVVEIDPMLYDLAKQHFGYRDDDRTSLFFEDGRTFMNRAEGPYDAIFMDAFKSEATVPYQLTTRETWARAYELLEDDGVIAMNVIASPTDERAPFFHALYATIADVFPNVRAFRVQLESTPGLPQNTMIVAAKDPGMDVAAAVAEIAPQFTPHLIEGYAPPPGTRLLTDDFAPVDQYLLGF